MKKEILNKHDKETFDNFNLLPDRAKELYWKYKNQLLVRYKDDFPFALEDELKYVNKYCESPIEKILYLALIIYRNLVDVDFDYELNPQFEVDNYRVDFMIWAYDCIWDAKNHCPLDEVSFDLIVECDGHDFHEKTKEQVAKNNNRDFKLKSMGYDILHFSGSEVFNDPMDCAKKIFDYIALNLDKERGIVK